MRGKTTLVLSVLCALLIFGSALSAYAAVNYTVLTTPLDAVKNGVAEQMGEVKLQLTTAAGTIATSDTITVLYGGATIANVIPAGGAVGPAGGGSSAAYAVPNGIVVTTTAGFPAFTVTTNNSSTGGQVIITFNGPGAPAVGDNITIDGVRASVVGKSIGAIISTQFSASPTGSSSFITTTAPTVAIVIDNFTLTPNDDSIVVSAPQCQAAGGTIEFKITEKDRDVFVQYVATTTLATPPSVTGRAAVLQRFGGNRNSQIHLVINNLQSGVKIYWPGSVVNASGVASHLELLSQSTAGDDAIYEFSTPDQAASDAAAEDFHFAIPIVASHTSGNIEVVVPATAALGTSTIQAQMYPPNPSGSTAQPRFDDPLNTAQDFLAVVRCVTNILFEWAGVDAANGYETGVAIANTSFDEGAIVPTTAPQEGSINIYFYPRTDGADQTAPTPITTAVIKAGDVYSNTFGGLGASKFGYAIAVCSFQYAHGFAFITQSDATGLRVAQGYTGLIIPDASIHGKRLAGPDGSGESLGQ
jgi:hypothetical protein